ncbi:hypothetical protein C0J52_13250 [Blattella germanica]|nr:hypothetical protein C0J52_13250 [Blattella germanica]
MDPLFETIAREMNDYARRQLADPNRIVDVTWFETNEDEIKAYFALCIIMSQDVRTVRLKLRKPESKKKVQWQSGTVDNEHLNKKKSKCCCQYEKPRAFDESSSSSSDDECENCHGHVERKKKKKKEPPGSSDDAVDPATVGKLVTRQITEKKEDKRKELLD